MTKKQKIIDTIFFDDEIEMLFFRLTELNSYVDSFIIVETESSKKLSFEKNKSLFKEWENKIIHIIVSKNDSCTFAREADLQARIEQFAAEIPP